MKVAIVGAGKLALTITEALMGGDNSVTLIDKNADLLQKIGSKLDVLTITANAKQIDISKELNIKSYDYLVAVTDTDEKNIVIGALMVILGISMVPSLLISVFDRETHATIGFLTTILLMVIIGLLV